MSKGRGEGGEWGREGERKEGITARGAGLRKVESTECDRGPAGLEMPMTLKGRY